MPALRNVGIWLINVFLCCIKPKVKGEEDEEEEWETFPLPGFVPKVDYSTSSSSDDDCEWGGRGDAERRQKARGRLRQRGMMYNTRSPSSPAFSLLRPRSPEVWKKRPKMVPWITGRAALRKGNLYKKRVREVFMAQIPNPVGKKRVDPHLIESLRIQCYVLENRIQRSGFCSGILRIRQRRIRKCLLKAAA